MDNEVQPKPPEQSENFSRAKVWIGRALFEGGLIIFSVLIALAVSNWADDQKTARRVTEMRNFIREEIRANRQMITAPEHLPHHLAIKAAFSAAGGYPGRPFHSELVQPALSAMFASGLHPVPVRDVVWSSVMSGDLIEHMPPREVFLLAELYKQQANLEGLNRAGYATVLPLVDTLSNPDAAPSRMVQTMAYLEDLTDQERRLIVAYDKALADLPK